jgi:hypothetical protein
MIGGWAMMLYAAGNGYEMAGINLSAIGLALMARRRARPNGAYRA